MGTSARGLADRYDADGVLAGGGLRAAPRSSIPLIAGGAHRNDGDEVELAITGEQD